MGVIPVTADAETFICNTYLVLDERTVLANAGTMSGVRDVVTEHTDDLGAVAVIHQHSDHVGKLGAVVERFGPDMYAYAGHPLRIHELGDGDRVGMGDEPFEMIYTSGHTGDHVSFVSGRPSFSGDMPVYNDGTLDDGNFGCTSMPGQFHERLISSLHTLLDRLPPTVEALYTGHGDSFGNEVGSDTVRDMLERIIERAERRESKYSEAWDGD